MPAASHSAGLFIDAVCLCVCVCVCACLWVRVRARESYKEVCACFRARARVCVRSQPAAESRQRRGTGRVGGEVMSGTRQRPTDEREGGEDEEEGRQGGRGGERSFLYCAAESRHRFSFLSDKVRLKVFIFSKKKKKSERGRRVCSVFYARAFGSGDCRF